MQIAHGVLPVIVDPVAGQLEEVWESFTVRVKTGIPLA